MSDHIATNAMRSADRARFNPWPESYGKGALFARQAWLAAALAVLVVVSFVMGAWW